MITPLNSVGPRLRRFALSTVLIATLSGCAAAPKLNALSVDPPPPTIEIDSPLPDDVDRVQLIRVLMHPPTDGHRLSDPAEWRFDTLAWVYQQANWRIQGYREKIDANGTLRITLEAAPEPAPWVESEAATTPYFWPDPTLRIIVDRRARRLYFLDDHSQVHTYPVTVGTARHPTPLQTFTVEQVYHQPAWYPPPSARRDHAERGEPLPAVVPPGPDNPLGNIFVKLQDSIGIHGTNRPSSIGFAASYGCIRMHNDHIAELSAALRIGDRVKVASSLAPDQRPY